MLNIYKYIVLILMWVIQLQVYLPQQIRQELRKELGLINVLVFPVLILINVFTIVNIFKRDDYREQKNKIYIMLSLCLYVFILYKLIS